MEYNGKTLTTVSLEQLRSLAETIETARREAIADMKTAAAAMHEQGRLLIQAELELGDAFDAFVADLPAHGIAEDQARYNMRLARKYDSAPELFADPGATKQLVLQNFAPQIPAKEGEAKGDKPAKAAAFTLTFHMNRDPMEWTSAEWDEFRIKSRPVANVWKEAKQRE
jgi:hypothetical protein